MALLPNIPAAPRRRRRRSGGSQGAGPAGPPVLVSAAWDLETNLLTLVFDRAIEIVDMPTEVFRVFDAVAGIEFRSSGDGTQPEPNVYVASLTDVGEYPGAGVTLDAVEPTHVFAAEGGGQWGGVTDLELPWP